MRRKQVPNGAFFIAGIPEKTAPDGAKREHCVQFQETDLDFFHRLLTEEGWFYFFDHPTGEGDERVVLAGRAEDYAPIAGLGIYTSLFAVNESVAAKTLPELVVQMRKLQEEVLQFKKQFGLQTPPAEEASS